MKVYIVITTLKYYCKFYIIWVTPVSIHTHHTKKHLYRTKASLITTPYLIPNLIINICITFLIKSLPFFWTSHTFPWEPLHFVDFLKTTYLNSSTPLSLPLSKIYFLKSHSSTHSLGNHISRYWLLLPDFHTRSLLFTWIKLLNFSFLTAKSVHKL